METDDQNDPFESYDPDEELTGSALVPSTRLGSWSVRLATAMMAPLLIFWLFAGRSLLGDGGLPAWILLAPTGLLGGVAGVTGVVALARQERALLVYLSSSIGLTVALSAGVSIVRG